LILGVSHQRLCHVFLYCHNVSGLGHIVRSIQIAKAVVDAGGAATIVTGCPALEAVEIDPRITVIRLPAVRRGSLLRLESTDPALAGVDVMKLRAERILDVTRAARPDVLLADLMPLGLRGELLPMLTAARAERWPTKFVWGVPYVEGLIADAPPPGNPRLRAAYAMYESAITYRNGTASELLDCVPPWARPPRSTSVGIVADPPLPRLSRRDGLVVVACGGGATAEGLCRDALAARRLTQYPDRISLRLVAGPLADVDHIQALTAGENNVEVLFAGALADVIRDAHVVVSRAGYNSTAQLLLTDFPLIFVPFAGGSGDQVTRARQLTGQPGVAVVNERIDAAATLAASIEIALAGPCTISRADTRSRGATNAATWLLDAARRDQA
jgi:predicted glycosyltransferase